TVACTLGGTSCGANQYCTVTACGKSGVCTTRPTPTNTQAPVCGCDNITYWNETLAAASGVNVATNAPCGDAGVKCSSSVKCATNASCNINVGLIASCGLGATGQCWVMPALCPSQTRSFRSCNGGGGCQGL